MIKKIRILGIAPYKGLATLMKQCALQYPEIEFTAYAGSMELDLPLQNATANIMTLSSPAQTQPR